MPLAAEVAALPNGEVIPLLGLPNGDAVAGEPKVKGAAGGVDTPPAGAPNVKGETVVAAGAGAGGEVVVGSVEGFVVNPDPSPTAEELPPNAGGVKLVLAAIVGIGAVAELPPNNGMGEGLAETLTLLRTSSKSFFNLSACFA